MLLAWTVLITFISHTSPLSCWEENQNNHQISDYKNNTTLFQYLAFGIESDVPGNVLIRTKYYLTVKNGPKLR